MVESIPLPHSKRVPYKGNYWPILEKDMSLLMKDPTLSRLEEVILKNIRRNTDTAQMVGKLDNLRKLFSNDFTVSMVPFLAHLVLQLPAFFPDKSLVMLRRGENRKISLTRAQVSF